MWSLVSGWAGYSYTDFNSFNPYPWTEDRILGRGGIKGHRQELTGILSSNPKPEHFLSLIYLSIHSFIQHPLDARCCNTEEDKPYQEPDHQPLTRLLPDPFK